MSNAKAIMSQLWCGSQHPPLFWGRLSFGIYFAKITAFSLISGSFPQSQIGMRTKYRNGLCRPYQITDCISSQMKFK